MSHMLKPAAGVDRGAQAACIIGISTTQVNNTKDVVKLMYNSRAQARKISFGLSKVHKCKRNMFFSLCAKIGNRNAHTRLVNAYIFFRNKVFGTYNCFTKNLAALRNPPAYLSLASAPEVGMWTNPLQIEYKNTLEADSCSFHAYLCVLIISIWSWTYDDEHITMQFCFL